MPERIIYRNAPIEEAVIDLRVASAIQDTSRLVELQENLRGEYSDCQAISSRPTNRRKDDKTDEDKTSTLGFRFVHHGKTKVLHAGLNGFLFSVLRPYDRWETFRDEARDLWNQYRAVHEFQSFTRVALRYLNRIDIPGEDIELTEYFRIGPHLPPSLTPQGFNGFLMQIGMEQPDLDCGLVINVGRVDPPQPDYVSIMLDIDIFRMTEDHAALWQDEEQEKVWEFVEQLHARKNEIFEVCITEKTRELFR